jgi:energy-coupling factor transport system ATP-binding protein
LTGERLITVQDLWHVYPGRVTALEGVSLEISRGELLSIIGQNGSGKTTLVKHFNGLLKPTKGMVFVKDLETKKASIPELSKYVGYLFQNPSHQLFNKTVEEELAFGPSNFRLDPSEIQKRVDDSIAFFGLEKYRKSHPLRLSLPDKKIVALASVYAIRPDVYVLDEPTTGQDHIGLRLIQTLIERLHKEGNTIVIVSHDMRLVAESSMRILVMYQANIVADGKPKEVFSNDSILKLTNLHPPQITQLSKDLDNPNLPKVALRVEELADPLAKIIH